MMLASACVMCSFVKIKVQTISDLKSYRKYFVLRILFLFEISKRVCIYISRLFCHVEVKIVIVGKASICFIENIGKLTLWYAVKKIELKKLRT